VRGFVALFPWIPLPLFSVFTRVAIELTFILLWKYRKRMEENLSLAMGREFPTREERRGLIHRAWRNFGQVVFETTCILFASREEIRSLVDVRGEEHLRQALARGKGVIALSAHLGNFTLIGARLAVGGYPFSVVVKQPRDRRFAGLIDHYRARLGMGTISAKPRREAARQVLRTLRRNEVVLLIADEFKSGGVQVEFLGRMAAAPRGPVTLAMRTGAAVLPMFITRDLEDRLTLYIRPGLDLVKTGDLQEDVAANATVFSRQLEDMVRRYPDQWNWLGFHRDGRRPRSEIGRPQTVPPNPEVRVSP